MAQALAHLRVIEIGVNVSAAYCTKLLADLGADVVKIEWGEGDPLQSTGTFPNDASDPTIGGLFRYLNANKHSVALDLEGKTGIDAVSDLVAQTDLIVENLGPGVLESMGLGFGQLRLANPRIALVRISNFGQNGPDADIPATDFTVQAAGGWISKHFAGLSNPVQVGGNLADYVSAAYAACAALTAWRSARSLGEAISVDVSKQECLLSTLPQPTLFLETLKKLGMGMPEDRVFPVPGVVRCKDGFVGINVLTAQHHADCCNMIGVPEYIPMQLDLNHAGPKLDQFYRDIGPWLMERTAEEIVELCQAFRIPAVPVGNGQNLPGFSQFKARAFYVIDPKGRFTQPGSPYRMEKTPVSLKRPASKIVEDSLEVIKASWSGRRATANITAPSTKDGYLPYRGLRVLDLGTFWAGPYVGCYLGAMGAGVIKIESIQRPDGLRYSMSYPQLGPDWYEQAGAWQATNLNKRNLTLDLNSSEGKRIFARMAANADVVVENYSPRVIDNFGFGVERLRELNPKLIIVRMPGFGLEGPWKDYVGWAMSIEQACGAAWVTGDLDGMPLNPGGFADPVIGMHALVAVQAALEHRDLTGEAQVIEVAQLETAACWTAEQVIAYSLAGKIQQRIGNRSETIAPQGVYKCAGSQWIALSVRSDQEWGRLVALMGSPEHANRFSSVEARMQNHAEIDRMISAWSASQTADAVVAAVRSAGIPISKVFTAVDMLGDPHLSARKFYQPLEHRTMGLRRYTRWPMVQNPGPMGTHRFGVATMGQHNAEILGKELGLSATDIDDLEKKQVIGTVPKGLK